MSKPRKTALVPGLYSTVVGVVPPLRALEGGAWGFWLCCSLSSPGAHTSAHSPKLLVYAHCPRALPKHCSLAKSRLSLLRKYPSLIKLLKSSPLCHSTTGSSHCLWSVPQKMGNPLLAPSVSYSAPLFLIKPTSKTQNRLIHMWTLPKLSSEGANTCLMFLWTHCCPFTCIYFAWPTAEPWKLENKLLFSQSCQRWPLCRRVDCGTNTWLIGGLFCGVAVSTVTYLSAEAFSLSCLCCKS